MLVRDLATTSPETVTPEFSLRNVMDLLRNNEFRHVPVVGDGRTLVGIVSQTDLASTASIARMFGSNREEYEKFLDRSVGAFLESRHARQDDLVVVGPDEALETAVERLLERNLSALPVVDEAGALFGILSYIDILDALADPNSDLDVPQPNHD